MVSRGQIVRNRPFLLIGTVLLIVGGFIVTTTTFGLSMTQADRGVSIETAPPESALLTLQDAYTDGEVSNYACIFGFCFPLEQPQTVLEIEHQFNDAVAVTETQVDGANAPTLEVREAPDTLGPDESEEVTLGCTGEVEDSGTTSVRFAVSIDGAGVAIEDANVAVENIEYDCAEIE